MISTNGMSNDVDEHKTSYLESAQINQYSCKQVDLRSYRAMIASMRS
jgi:hypothetical protein